MGFTQLAATAGLPLAPTRACFHLADRISPALGVHLQTLEKARDFLRDTSNYPLFGKPAFSQSGYGAAFLVTYDRASDRLVAPYRIQGKGGKNDANDAAAICEAASRPQMHFVPIKTIEQQSMLCIHRLREGLKQERNACTNRIRGLLGEFGLVFAQKVANLRQVLPDVLEDASNELGGLARLALQRAQQQWEELDAHMAWCDERIAAHAKACEQVRQAEQLAGIGPVTASAVIATVGDFKQFRNGSQFGAWLGLTPRQNSSGGKNNLSSITKRGDMYLRMLLIQGAKSAVMNSHKRDDPISKWAHQLKEKAGWQKAVANKNARILWAVFVRGKAFDANHVSVKPVPLVGMAAAAAMVAMPG